MKRIILCMVLLELCGCAMVTTGVVGAAVAPIVQPLVERALVQIGVDIFDKAAAAAEKPPVPNQ